MVYPADWDRIAIEIIRSGKLGFSTLWEIVNAVRAVERVKGSVDEFTDIVDKEFQDRHGVMIHRSFPSQDSDSAVTLCRVTRLSSLE